MLRLTIIILATSSFGCGGVSGIDPDGGAQTTDASTDGGLTIDTCSTSILFESANDIWRINTDGTGRTKLTDTGNNRAAEWSPGGSQIAFVSDRDGSDAVFVMDPDGTNPLRVSGADVPATDPQWIPQSAPGPERISYVVVNGADTSLIAIASGGAREVIRDAGMLPETEIGWAGSGEKYTFFGSGISPGETFFWVGTVGDTGRSGFDAPPFGASVWSPNDDRILYELNRDIWSVSANTGTATIMDLTNLGGSLRASTAQWFSSNKILFTRDSVPSGQPNIYIMTDDGTAPTPLTTNDISSTPRLSPDKTQIAFTLIDTRVEIGVMELNADFTVGPQVTLTLGSRPRWRPCAQ